MIVKAFPAIVFILFLFFFAVSPMYASSYVTASGQKLILNNASFQFLGVNRYNLLTVQSPVYRGCGGSWSEADLDNWFSQQSQLGTTVIRFWAFQLFTSGATDFSRFDYVLSLAQKYNIRLLPVLENQWTECTQGGYKYNTWYASGYLSPYGSYTLSYKDYVGKVVTHYKNNPYILIWQLMNEAESKNTNNQEDEPALYNFAKDMSGYIKSIDPNHLVSLGTMGSGQPSTGGDYYYQIHSLPTIDVLDYHDYGLQTTALPETLAQRFRDANSLHKPLFIGEAGIKANCSDNDCYSFDVRANLFNNKMTAFFTQHGAGYLIWSYQDTPLAPIEPFDFVMSDPLAQVYKKFAAKIGTLAQTTPTLPIATPSPTLTLTPISTLLMPTTTPSLSPTFSPTPTTTLTPSTSSPISTLFSYWLYLLTQL